MRTTPPALSEPAAVRPGPAGDGWIEAAVLPEPGSRALEEHAGLTLGLHAGGACRTMVAS